jgi:hypothetical protein
MLTEMDIIILSYVMKVSKVTFFSKIVKKCWNLFIIQLLIAILLIAILFLSDFYPLFV